LLADTLSLGEMPSPDPMASWSPPAVLPDVARVKAVVTELERGLRPTRPEFLKWICDKLSALPSQNANGVNAALWSDNVIDVCDGYPEDLLQSACLEVLKTRTFRPSPAEIMKVIEAKHSERVRMLARAKRLLPEAPKPAAAAVFVREPQETRLRTLATSLRKVGQHHRAAQHERELAALENREPESWVNDYIGDRAPGFVKAPDPKLPPVSPSSQAALLRTVARKHREQGREGLAAMLERQADALAPVYVEEPLGDAHGEAA